MQNPRKFHYYFLQYISTHPFEALEFKTIWQNFLLTTDYLVAAHHYQHAYRLFRSLEEKGFIKSETSNKIYKYTSNYVPNTLMEKLIPEDSGLRAFKMLMDDLESSKTLLEEASLELKYFIEAKEKYQDFTNHIDQYITLTKSKIKQLTSKVNVLYKISSKIRD